MSAARKKPVTPLPWRAQNWTCHAPTTVVVDDPSAPTGKHVVAETSGFGRLGTEAAADAAYIAHAANAYPKLVAALRDRLLYATDLEYRVVADAAAAQATAGNVTHEEAQNERDVDLLRELGEDQ